MLEDIDEVSETMRIEEEPHVHDEIHPIETFAKCGNAPDFKFFEALRNTILNIDDQLFCFNVQLEAGQMYDELRCLFVTFEQNFNKLTYQV